jgi:hypothetical protein
MSQRSVNHILPTAILSTAIGPIAFVIACLTACLQGQCATQWLPGDGLPGTYGPTRAATMWDPDGAGPKAPVVVLGGGFEIAGRSAAHNIVAYDPATGIWAPLGSGLDGDVFALTTLPNGDLVAGGGFLTAGSVTVNHIARWDGTSWCYQTAIWWRVASLHKPAAWPQTT